MAGCHLTVFDGENCEKQDCNFDVKEVLLLRLGYYDVRDKSSHMSERMCGKTLEPWYHISNDRNAGFLYAGFRKHTIL